MLLAIRRNNTLRSLITLTIRLLTNLESLRPQQQQHDQQGFCQERNCLVTRLTHIQIINFSSSWAFSLTLRFIGTDPMFHKTPPRDQNRVGKQINLRFPMVVSEKRSVHHFLIYPIMRGLCAKQTIRAAGVEEGKKENWKRKIQEMRFLDFHENFHWVRSLNLLLRVTSTFQHFANHLELLKLLYPFILLYIFLCFSLISTEN